MAGKARRSTKRSSPKASELEVLDSSSLTDADWATINELRNVYERGGSKALSAAFDKLAKDPLRYVRVVGSLFPNMIREMIRDALAAKGITRKDIEEIVHKFKKPTRLH